MCRRLALMAAVAALITASPVGSALGQTVTLRYGQAFVHASEDCDVSQAEIRAYTEYLCL